MDVLQLPWVQEFNQKYFGGIAHAFIFHGAIDDYVGHQDGVPITAQRAFANYLCEKRTVVCRYNYSGGLSFVNEGMRKPFYAALGKDAPAKVAGEILYPNPRDALHAIEEAIFTADPDFKIAIIIEDAELLWPEGDYSHLPDTDKNILATLRRWARSPEFIDRAPIITLWTAAAGDLHSSLRTASSLIEQINLSYPTTQERRDFIAERLEHKPSYQLAEGLNVDGFANLTGGLSRILIDDVCLRAAVEERAIDYSLIKSRKDQIIRDEYGDLIEILEPRYNFDAVGGMHEVKQYLHASVINPLKDPRLHSRMPSGVLLAGPPGTGKTMLVTALAAEAGVSVVKLNAGRLLGQYVGNSERNLERALLCIRSLAPTIVMIDEIEQQFQRGGADGSGVERRIFGRILEEMSGSSSQRGEVIWFAATNRVDLVDPALRRPGRFDKIVPILPPTGDERWEILQRKLPGLPATAPPWLIDQTHHYTGADLDGLLIKAAELAYDRGNTAANAEDIQIALSLLRPSHDPEATEEMIQQALHYCNDLSLIPPEWREAVAADMDEKHA